MKAGDVVPDFELPDQTGEMRRFSDFLAKGPVALFFYPAALTLGCTMESCHFRDLAAEFAAVGAQRVGISGDPVDKQRQFSDKHGFDYPLLSDERREVAEMFGVKRNISLVPTKRTTFVIDTDARVLEVISSEVRMNAHADRALARLKRLSPS